MSVAVVALSTLLLPLAIKPNNKSRRLGGGGEEEEKQIYSNSTRKAVAIKSSGALAPVPSLPWPFTPDRGAQELVYNGQAINDPKRVVDLIIDCSGSVSAFDIPGAVRGAMERLAQQERTLINVTLFSSSAVGVCKYMPSDSLRDDPSVINQIVARVFAKGFTRHNDTLAERIEELIMVREAFPGVKLDIIKFTDGVDNRSHMHKTAAQVKALIGMARANGINVKHVDPRPFAFQMAREQGLHEHQIYASSSATPLESNGVSAFLAQAVV